MKNKIFHGAHYWFSSLIFQQERSEHYRDGQPVQGDSMP